MQEHSGFEPFARRIYMSEQELNDRFKRAGGISQDTIQIIAELNNVPPNLMAKHLGFADLSDAPLFVGSDEIIMRLYKRGLTDRQMAETLHTSRMPIRTWRTKHGLPPNNYNKA